MSDRPDQHWGCPVSARAAFAALLLLLPASLDAQEKGDDAPVPGWRNEFLRRYELFRDYGHDWRAGAFFGYTPEYGVLLGGGPILYEFAFRTFPYRYRMSLFAGVALPSGRFAARYTLGMPALGKGFGLEAEATYTELEIINFYGFGNDAPRDEAKEDDRFYRVASSLARASALLTYRLGASSRAGISAGVTRFSFTEEENRYLSPAAADSLGTDFTFLSAGALWTLDTRDHSVLPHRGVFAEIAAANNVELSGKRHPFQRLAGTLRVYLGDTLLTDTFLAFRIGAEKLFGAYPFYESAFLGGPRSLRGYQTQRFAGDASLYGGVEVRSSMARPMILVPFELGIVVLGEAGRVWIDGQSPGPWHADVGAGVWGAPISRDLAGAAVVVWSSEGVMFRAGVGFDF